MNKKIFIFVIIISCLLVGTFWILKNNFIKSGNTTTFINIATNENRSLSTFSGQSTDEDRVLFTSDLYHFSFITGFEFWYSAYPITGIELGSYMLARRNTNTNMEQNRDTPNGFNTAVEDRMIVVIYENGKGLTPDDLDAFRSWQAIEDNPTVKEFDDVTALEAITASGIGAFSRTFYFLSDNYIVEISSADVSKDELYDIVETFRWLSD